MHFREVNWSFVRETRAGTQYIAHKGCIFRKIKPPLERMPAHKVLASILFVQTISSIEVWSALLLVPLVGTVRLPVLVLVLADQRCNSYRFLLFKISSCFQFSKVKELHLRSRED